MLVFAFVFIANSTCECCVSSSWSLLGVLGLPSPLCRSGETEPEPEYERKGAAGRESHILADVDISEAATCEDEATAEPEPEPQLEPAGPVTVPSVLERPSMRPMTPPPRAADLVGLLGLDIFDGDWAAKSWEKGSGGGSMEAFLVGEGRVEDRLSAGGREALEEPLAADACEPERATSMLDAVG
jgi:hypothetical protein